MGTAVFLWLLPCGLQGFVDKIGKETMKWICLSTLSFFCSWIRGREEERDICIYAVSGLPLSVGPL